MRLNPFNSGKPDELGRQIEAQQEAQSLDLASQDGMPEQTLMADMKPDPDLTKWQQNAHPWLKKMVHRLKREVEVSEDVWKPINGMKPMCSDECIMNLLGQLEGNTSPNVMKSKFNDEQISKEMWLLEKNIILYVLIPERKKYGTALNDLAQVKKVFRSFAMPTYFRALGGFESLNERAIRSYKELHSSGQKEEPKKKGFWGF